MSVTFRKPPELEGNDQFITELARKLRFIYTANAGNDMVSIPRTMLADVLVGLFEEEMVARRREERREQEAEREKRRQEQMERDHAAMAANPMLEIHPFGAAKGLVPGAIRVYAGPSPACEQTDLTDDLVKHLSEAHAAAEEARSATHKMWTRKMLEYAAPIFKGKL